MEILELHNVKFLFNKFVKKCLVVSGLQIVKIGSSFELLFEKLNNSVV